MSNKTTSLDKIKSFQGQTSSSNSFFNNQLPNSNASFPNPENTGNLSQQPLELNEPIPTPLEIDDDGIQNQENKTIHNIINHFENLNPDQQNLTNNNSNKNYPPNQNSFIENYQNNGIESMNNMEYYEENIPIIREKKKKQPLWKKIIRNSLKLIIWIGILFIFLYKPIQNFLRKILSSFYNIEGFWDPKIIIVFAIILSSLQFGSQFIIDKYI